MDKRSVAYFSMEIGINAEIPTYSGGLGVLAGDTIRAAADLRVPMVAVTLIHRKGYFKQKLDGSGGQSEQPVDWVVEDFFQEETPRVSVTISGRTVWLRAWRHDVVGIEGYSIPVYCLGSQLPENSEWDQGLTDYLYGGDNYYRLCQEVILGVGGVRMLRALGYQNLTRFHINEGHASLLTIELLNEQLNAQKRDEPHPEDLDAVREACVFTTHTPVPAGHDRFSADTVERVLDERPIKLLRDVGCLGDHLNMTHLALRLSHFVNGVSERHAEVSRQLFPDAHIVSVTNGVHAGAWVSAPFQDLFDRHIDRWRTDGLALRQALRIPTYDIWSAHIHAKKRLIEHINKNTSANMDPAVFTIAFGRRVATYKRANLIFEDMERLRRVNRDSGPMQLIFAGKAHPHDEIAKDLIRHIFWCADQLKSELKLVYLEDYNMSLCKLMTSGADLWLNNPEPPLEASGTSGMKAALNGVPSLSILDGWWLEGWVEGVTGWSIGKDLPPPYQGPDRKLASQLVYDKLEYVILPMFYEQRDRFVDVMRHSIAINGSFFNTHRMIEQYVLRAYMPPSDVLAEIDRPSSVGSGAKVPA